MSCSQIASRHFSTSATSVGETLDSDANFAGLLGAVFEAGAVPTGAGSPIPARSNGVCADGLLGATPALISPTLLGADRSGLADVFDGVTERTA